ncbi:hypothetical protein BT69DRAFT_1285727 [Atractiella rhizophila]|nr:hypothetical protein BT69DRAFT_1285727 [Atractiella rhizophila]
MKDNASFTLMFRVLHDVAPYLASLRIGGFNFAALDSSFTFPPVPMLKSLTIDNTHSKLPLELDKSLPHFPISNQLRYLVLPLISQLSAHLLSSSVLTRLEVTTQSGDLDEEANKRISCLPCLKKLKWGFRAPPTNCVLPISITDLTLRSVSETDKPVLWSIQDAFPNFPDLSNLSSLVLGHFLPLPSNFPPCQFQLSKLHIGEKIEHQDSIVTLLDASAVSLVDFRISATSLQDLRQLLYFFCGGRNNSSPTFVDVFKVLNSRLRNVHINVSTYKWTEFEVRGNFNAGELRFRSSDITGETEFAAGLNSAIMEGLLPSLKEVSIPVEVERDTLKTLDGLKEKHQIKVTKYRVRSSTPIRFRNGWM